MGSARCPFPRHQHISSELTGPEPIGPEGPQGPQGEPGPNVMPPPDLDTGWIPCGGESAHYSMVSEDFLVDQQIKFQVDNDERIVNQDYWVNPVNPVTWSYQRNINRLSVVCGNPPSFETRVRVWFLDQP